MVTEEAAMGVGGDETGDTPCEIASLARGNRKRVSLRDGPGQLSPISLCSLPDWWQSKLRLVPLNDGELIHSKVTPVRLAELSRSGKFSWDGEKFHLHWTFTYWD